MTVGGGGGVGCTKPKKSWHHYFVCEVDSIVIAWIGKKQHIFQFRCSPHSLLSSQLTYVRYIREMVFSRKKERGYATLKGRCPEIFPFFPIKSGPSQRFRPTHFRILLSLLNLHPTGTLLFTVYEFTLSCCSKCFFLLFRHE